MKGRIVLFVIAGLCAALCVSLFFNYKQYRDAQERTETVRVVMVESKEKTETAPKPVAERDIGKIHVPVKKVTVKSHETEDVRSGFSTDSLELSGDSVAVPISQKVYSDSAYTAYVSGYGQSLDSIKVKTVTIHETVTTTKAVPKFRRWNVGVIGGYGYGFTSRQVEPFVGIGVTLSLF